MNKSLSLAIVLCTGLGAHSALATPVASITLTDSGTENLLGTVNPGDSVEFEYTAAEALSVSGLSFSATGGAAGGVSPLASLQFGFTPPGGEALSLIGTEGGVSGGLGFLDPLDLPGGGSLSTDDTFSVFVTNTSTESFVLTSTVTTGAPGPISELPATVSGPAAASVTLAADNVDSVLGSLAPGLGVAFDFAVGEDLSVTGIGLSATGPNGTMGSALDFLDFGFSTADLTGLSSVEVSGGAAAGFGFLDPDDLPGGGDLLAGDVYSIFVLNNSSETIALTTTVTTAGPAVIPLPASAWLMLAGLMSLGAYRKKKA